MPKKKKPRTIQKRSKEKGYEYQHWVAEFMGGRNIGTLGGEDVEHPVWSIECKNVARFAGEKFMKQSEVNCPEGKIPIVFVHLPNFRHPNDLVMLRLKDIESYLKRKKVK